MFCIVTTGRKSLLSFVVMFGTQAECEERLAKLREHNPSTEVVRTVMPVEDVPDGIIDRGRSMPRLQGHG